MLIAGINQKGREVRIIDNEQAQKNLSLILYNKLKCTYALEETIGKIKALYDYMCNQDIVESYSKNHGACNDIDTSFDRVFFEFCEAKKEEIVLRLEEVIKELIM